MNRLENAPELLDGPLDDEAALRHNLRDLRRLNRLLGGVDLSARGLDALAPDGRRPETLLDVGTGSADIPKALLARSRRTGHPLSITATDARSEIIGAAQAIDPSLRRTPRLVLGIADGRSLPYPDGAFDVAHASLLVHHLDPGDAVAVLGELRRVARVGVVVNDLLRGRLQWLAARALTMTIARGRYTRHDGPLSVLRAYTLAELHGLLEEAGLQPVATFVGLVGHRCAIAAR